MSEPNTFAQDQAQLSATQGSQDGTDYSGDPEGNPRVGRPGVWRGERPTCTQVQNVTWILNIVGESVLPALRYKMSLGY